jgi:hypothetical protein
MIKLKPEKSREAIIAYLFAFFSPSPNVSFQKKDTNSPIGIKSEVINPSGIEKDPQSQSGTINRITKTTNIRISTTETTTDKTTGSNNPSIASYKSSVALYNKLHTFFPGQLIDFVTGNNPKGIFSHAVQFKEEGGQYIPWFSRVKIDFHKKWSLISTTMAWNFQKMTKTHHFDNQLFYNSELKYTVIFFLYN